MLKTQMRTKNLTGARRAFDPFFGTLGPQALEGSLWDQEIYYIVAPFRVLIDCYVSVSFL